MALPELHSTTSIPTILLRTINNVLKNVQEVLPLNCELLHQQLHDIIAELKEFQSIEAENCYIEQKDVSQLKALATENFQNKHYKQALYFLAQSIVLQPDESSHYANCSLAYLRLGNLDLALKNAEKAVELKPDWGKAYFRLAMALRESGENEKCLINLRLALKYDLNKNEKESVIKEIKKLDTSDSIVSNILPTKPTLQQGLPSSLETNIVSADSASSPPSSSPASIEVQPTSSDIAPDTTVSDRPSSKLNQPINPNHSKKLKPCNFKWFNKKSTFPLKICTNDDDNRRFIATRDINAGELIWSELPIATIVQSQYEDKICHYCYNYSNQLKLKCPKCQSAYWCSTQCQQLHQQRHVYECQICVKTKSINKQAQALRLIMQLLFLSSTNENIRNMLKDLQWSNSISSSSCASSTTLSSMSSDMIKDTTIDSLNVENGRLFDSKELMRKNDFKNKRMLAAVMKLGQIFGSEINQQELIQLIGCVDVNSFVVTDLEGRRLGNALFSGASFFNHSCIPNAVIGFDLGNAITTNTNGTVNHTCNQGLAISVRSNRVIKQGEEVSIGYIELFRSTYVRQKMLLESKNFICSCLRCRSVFAISPSNESLQNENKISVELETLFNEADSAVTKAMMTTSERKPFDTALITIIKSFKICPECVLKNMSSHDSSHDWFLFELHCLVVSLILHQPQQSISPSLVQSLLTTSSSIPSSMKITENSDELDNTLHKYNKMQLKVLHHHAALAVTYSQQGYSNDQYHPRIALCKQNLGNALMLLAGSSNNTLKLELSRRACVEYREAGNIVEACWGATHPNCSSLRTLQHWAHKFCS